MKTPTKQEILVELKKNELFKTSLQSLKTVKERQQLEKFAVDFAQSITQFVVLLASSSLSSNEDKQVLSDDSK